jgi:hypothetical protein
LSNWANTDSNVSLKTLSRVVGSAEIGTELTEEHGGLVNSKHNTNAKEHCQKEHAVDPLKSAASTSSLVTEPVNVEQWGANWQIDLIISVQNATQEVVCSPELEHEEDSTVVHQEGSLIYGGYVSSKNYNFRV